MNGMEELRPLWFFVQVARHGSLSAAAQALGVSAAAVSKSISRLEARMGLRLFSRATRSLQLSDEGRRLFEQLDGSFASIQGALHEAQSDRDEVSGSVRLSTVTGVGRTWVIPALVDFFELHPKVDVLLSVHDGARGLSRHTYDLRINWGEEREQNKVAHRLFKMDLTLVASPGYLARHGVPRKPADLDRHHCIQCALNNNQRGRWLFTRRGGKSKAESVAPWGRLVVADELTVVSDAALAGLGLTVIARDNIAQHLASGTLVQVMSQYHIESSDQLQTEVILQHPPRKLMSPATRALVDFLLSRIGQSG